MSTRYVSEEARARLSAVANVILGLLILKPMSLYDLVGAFRSGISLFYSASTGSIKRALDSLIADGYVEVGPAESSGRGRKAHMITPAGRQHFHDWMVSELTGGSTETAALSRLFFLGLIDADERPAVVRQIEARLEREIAELDEVREQISSQDVPEEWREAARYQRATLDYGTASYGFALNWFREALSSIEQEEQ